MRILRDPAFHFVVVGALLFALNYQLAPDAIDPNAILVTDEVVASLQETHRSLTDSDADEETTQRLIDEWVREEAIIREAEALGMVRDDALIRRRILQKMDTLLQDTAAIDEPTDAQLEAWLAARPQQYVRPARVSFEHVFFAFDAAEGSGAEGSGAQGRALPASERARDALAALRGGGDSAGLGDTFAPGGSFARLQRPQIVGTFSEEFASVLEAAPDNEWFGPLRSEHGWHVVRVSQREEASRAPLAEIRDRVRQAWEAEAREAARDEALDLLVERYPPVRIRDGAE